MKDFNYFAEGEQAAQQEFQKHRDSAFGPVVRLLVTLRVSPNVISALGMLMLAPFAWMVISDPQPQRVALACAFLLAHVVLDGIDGALARRMGAAGPAGALVDMCCDHGGLILVTWIISAAGLIDGTIGNVYAASYTVAVVFIIWLNSLGQPFRFVFRSKYFLYGLLFLLGVISDAESPRWRWLDWSLIGFSAGNLWICILGFMRAHRILRQQQ